MRARVLLTALLVATSTAVGAAPAGAADPPLTPASGFAAVTPVRILDSRGGARLAAGQPRRLVLPDAPSGATAVSLNLTISEAVRPGWSAVHPCGQTPGATSTLNFVASVTVANAAPSTTIESGVCVTTAEAAHVIVDVTGWWTTGGAPLTAGSPLRLIDTRADGSAPVRRTALRVPTASASALAATLIVTQPTGSGWAAVHPCDQPPGGTSTVNFQVGETVANLALVRADRGVCVTSSVPAHVIVDQVAVAATGPVSMQTVAPQRVFDSRGELAWLGASAVVRLRGLPTSTMLLNVTAVAPFEAGFVTVWPCSEARPTVSQLSWTDLRNVATAVVARTDGNGEACLAPSGGTHLLIDLLASDAAFSPAVASVVGRTNEWVFGTSVEGRPLKAAAYGTPGGVPVVGIGVIHGNEQSGLPIVERLRAQPVPKGVTMWLISSVNPDGQRRPIRQNSRGVDLNRNFPLGWRSGPSGTANYPGLAPSSEPETKATIRFLDRIQPTLGVWWHTVGNYADDSRTSMEQPELLERYVAVASIGIDDAPCSGFCGGTASQYANGTLANGSHFVVELPDAVDSTQINAHAAGFIAAAALVRR